MSAGLRKPQVLGRGDGAPAQDEDQGGEEALMCSLCYAVTRERCNNGCGGVVPVCSGCKMQGKTCSFCDDMREFGGGQEAAKPAQDFHREDVELGSTPPRKSAASHQDSSSDDDDNVERELISSAQQDQSRSSSKRRSTSQKSRTQKNGKAKLSGPLADGKVQAVVAIVVLLIVGIAMAYLFAPDQVAAGVSAALDFGAPDETVITQGFVASHDDVGCMDQTVHVSDRSACQTAAAFLKRRFGGMQKGGGPEGCYAKGFTVYYNSRSTHTLVQDAAVHFVCELGVMYGEMGDELCPKDAAPIADEELCRMSATALAQGWGGLTNVASKPKGCYEQEELLSLNTHELGGLSADVKRVCASSSGASRAP